MDRFSYDQLNLSMHASCIKNSLPNGSWGHRNASNTTIISETQLHNLRKRILQVFQILNFDDSYISSGFQAITFILHHTIVVGSAMRLLLQSPLSIRNQSPKILTDTATIDMHLLHMIIKTSPPGLGSHKQLGQGFTSRT